jgi:hypothetical protein
VDPEFDQVSEAVLAWMHAHGFPDAHLTEDAGHGAFDVDAAQAIAEINLGSPPSRPNVQRLDTVSRNENRRALYFSVRGFTNSAEEWANNVNIALFAFEKGSDDVIVPVNALAEELDKEPPTREKQLLDAATRAVATGMEELHEEQQLSGVDEETRNRIQTARENKRMRRNLFG